MESGSDDGGSEAEEFEQSGGTTQQSDIWEERKNKKKKRKKSECEDSYHERDEYKLFIKLMQEGATFKEWNPIQLTKSLNKEMGEVRSAKILRNGQLLVFCENEEQLKKALSVKKFNGKVVQCTKANDNRRTRGVITGVPANVTTEALKGNIKHVKVSEVKRLKTKRDGEICNSLSVMIVFEEEQLPDRVFVGYMSYDVKLYIPPPLRCYKCQRFGHTAAVCRAKKRCSKCGGEHEYEDCDKDYKRCCNCGGEHSAAYQGCEFSKRAKEVQRVKVTQGISYSEAVRKVPKVVPVPKQGESNESQNVMPANNRVRCNNVNLDNDGLVINKGEFVLFMAEIINCSAQTQSRTARIKIIVKAAEKYLGIKGLLWETVRDNLSADSQSSQAASSDD